MNDDTTFSVKEAEAPEPIPVGVYPAKFVSFDKQKDGSYGPYLRLDFEITEGDYAGTKRNLIASSKLTKGKTSETNSKLFNVVTGLLGREPRKDEAVSLKNLLETECQILVENKPGDEGWQIISKIIPAKTKNRQVEGSGLCVRSPPA